MQLFEQSEIREIIETHITSDPVKLALKLKLPREQREAVCEQVKMLQRAADKLPLHYEARCWLPQRAFEQSTSEAVAAAKFGERGRLAFDLTCGLGVDTMALARNFEQVISVSADQQLADVVEHNLKLLSIDNVVIVRTTAEEFLANWNGENPDLIYLDPDRRDVDGKKVVVFDDCSPNVNALMPKMLELAPKVIIKCSPLFDVDEAFRIFGDRAAVEVVSYRGECKEVLISVHRDAAERDKLLSAVVINQGRIGRVTSSVRKPHSPNPTWTGQYKYLFAPDVALCRARLLGAVFGTDAYVVSENGYVFADEIPENYCGQVYRVEQILRYRAREISALLKSENTTRATLLQRDFDVINSEIASELKIKEGGSRLLAFTTVQGQRIVIFCEKI